MKKFTLKKNNEIIFQKCTWAGNPFLKMKGLLGRNYLDPEEAMIFPDAPSLHTFFMQFPIDILFLDKTKKVIQSFEKIKPNRLLPYIKSRFTIEMPAGAIEEKQIKGGDDITWDENGQVTMEFALLIGVLILSIAFVWPSLVNTFNSYVRNILDYLYDF